jgi:hypothetical protein
MNIFFRFESRVLKGIPFLSIRNKSLLFVIFTFEKKKSVKCFLFIFQEKTERKTNYYFFLN